MRRFFDQRQDDTGGVRIGKEGVPYDIPSTVQVFYLGLNLQINNSDIELLGFESPFCMANGKVEADISPDADIVVTPHTTVTNRKLRWRRCTSGLC